jgi:hypothetical protein
MTIEPWTSLTMKQVRYALNRGVVCVLNVHILPQNKGRSALHDKPIDLYMIYA